MPIRRRLALTSTFFASIALLAAPAFANPTVSTPANGSSLTTPFTLSASASSCSSAPISAMGYSLDNSASNAIVNGGSINASVSASTGKHTLHVKSWGTNGSSCVTDVAITVTGATAAVVTASSSAVAVNSPSNGANVQSPFTLSASSPSCGGHSTAAMGYSFDNGGTTIVGSTSINSSISAANGSHTLHVKSWGNGGGSCDADIAINVTAPANAAALPSNAISVSSIQVLGGWQATNDSAGSGWSSGSTGTVGSPAYNGTARKFSVSFSNSGNERFWVSFGDDTQSTNFLYDGWVYIPSGANSTLANIEMDMNQTMPNGQTAIFGFQCDGWNSTWDYTKNAGSPTSPNDVWVKSNQYCNARTWSTNTWHHVQVSYSRDDSGNITYNAVWLDDKEEPINATVNSAFALGWAPTLLTNFQVDGYGSSGSTTVYLDDLQIYRW
jgi:hypothetical protein